jgi:hypothetical protein
MMIRTGTALLAFAVSACLMPALGQTSGLAFPKNVTAGSAFTIPTSGAGRATLYVAGPSEVFKRDVQLGQPLVFSASDLDHAGHYLAVLVSDSSSETSEFDVVPASQPADLTFLARPSRLPVDLQNGITGAVYLFDPFQNLIMKPTPVSFELSVPSGATQTRTATTNEGAAWTEMNSATKEGSGKFVAQAGNISATRIIQQVPGDPCGLKMTARKVGDKLDLVTDPLRDCNGNAVSEGTIVTFTESWNGGETTVDVPVKHDVAEVQVPAYNGARISVATGVVMGNEIRWEGQ